MTARGTATTATAGVVNLAELSRDRTAADMRRTVGAVRWLEAAAVHRVHTEYAAVTG